VSAELGTAPKKVDKKALEMMVEYSWPGNVRELRNLIERLCILTQADTIKNDDMPHLVLTREEDMMKDPFGLPTYQEFRDFTEREFLVKKLRENNGNVSKTARQLGMQRSNLYKKLEKFSIDLRGDKNGEE
jgi:two-component system nitrogen regulation response regulator NtrX